ncbi:MAG: hypothetical protein L0Z62_10355 [Gemmataceae bacterium]|nr:hypothetical protein [Gemmataceae bacterium]
MRRALGTAVVAFTLLLLTLPTPASGWFFRHHHKRYHAGYYAQPVAAPLTLGFQFPWGGQVTTEFDIQQFLQRRREARDPDTKGPARVTVPADVAKKITEIESSVNLGVDKLNALLERLESDREQVEKDLRKIDRKLKTLHDGPFQKIEKRQPTKSGTGVSKGTGREVETEKGP